MASADYAVEWSTLRFARPEPGARRAEFDWSELEPGAIMHEQQFTPQAIWGRELRFHRERAGLTQAELASRLYCSDSLISSIETGQAPATPEFAEALNTDGVLLRQLDWRKGVPPYPTWFIDWIPAEEKAVRLRAFEVNVIYGLLQTPDYARAVFGRNERQVSPPQSWRGRENQHSGSAGDTAQRRPRAVATLVDGKEVAYTEGAFGGTVSARSEDIATVITSWESIRGDALPVDMSRDLIAQIAGEWNS